MLHYAMLHSVTKMLHYAKYLVAIIDKIRNIPLVENPLTKLEPELQLSVKQQLIFMLVNV